MDDDILQQLTAMDQATLTELVRKDQRDPELVLLDWPVEPRRHEKIIDSTGGLFRFSGQYQGRESLRQNVDLSQVACLPSRNGENVDRAGRYER